jgi:hypothetical protein
MVEFLAAGAAVSVMVFTAIQIAILWAGQGSVDTAAHFAAREFARSARDDYGKAKAAAFEKAVGLCRLRPGGMLVDAALTSLDFTREPSGRAATLPTAGDAYRVRLSHWVELVVPLANRILYEVAPVQKTRLGGRYYLVLHATRYVTVE